MKTENNKHVNVCDTLKSKLRGKFSDVNAYIKKKKYQINNLTLHLKQLEKEEQGELKATRRKEAIDYSWINERENRKTTEINNKIKVFFLKDQYNGQTFS